MINNRPCQQQGAMLIFSLLLLLVITLVGVTMIQQNRTQFMMTENTQSQALNFASAENVLALAENYIAGQRYATWPLGSTSACVDNTGAAKACSTYNCKAPNGVFTQLMPGALNGGTVINVATNTNVEITKTVCIGASNVGLQYVNCSQTGQTFCNYVSNVANPSAPSNLSNNPCHTEMYSIRARVLDSFNNIREVTSNYAVRCDN
jgi:Tfp pilus assembly protein PilX